MDYVHVFVLRTLCLDEDGEIRSRNVAVTLDMFEAEDHRNKGVENGYDTFVVPGDWRGAMTTQELARYYLSQGKMVRAAALMMTLIETEPTMENLELLAEIYMQQGLFDDAAELYLRVVKAGLR